MSSPVTPDQTSEPVLIAHAVTVILAAVVSLGWVAIPNDTIDLVGTGVALLVSTVVAVVARGKVTPVAKASTLDAAAIRLLVAEVVRTELATLSAYRAATDTPAAPEPPVQLSYPASNTAALGNVRVDWMGRPSER